LKISKRWEKFYVMSAFMFFVQAWQLTEVGESDSSTQRWLFDPTSFVAQGLLYSILGLLLFVHWKKVWRGLQSSGWVLALIAFAIASAAWSLDPIFTLRRGTLLLATTIFGVYFGTCFDWEEQLGMLGWLFVISVVGSFIAATILPRYGISHDVHAGDWKGIFPHKNLLGRQMALGILTMAIGRPRTVPRWVRYASLVAGAALMMLSHSGGAIIATVAILAAYPLLNILRWKRRNTLPLWIALAPLVSALLLLVIMNSGTILKLVGRDATLTGRTPLWVGVEQAIDNKPTLGHGYAVFWVRPSRDLNTALLAGSWDAQSAQNGYLDLELDLGSVGMILFAFGFVVALWRSVNLFRTATSPVERWPLIYLLFFGVYNVVESDLLRLNTFLWVPYVAVVVGLAGVRAESPHWYRFLGSKRNRQHRFGDDLADVTQGS